MLPPSGPGKVPLVPALLLAGCMAFSCGGEPPPIASSPVDRGWPAGTVWYDPVAGMELVWVPPGSFLMGSPPEEEGRQANDLDEGPRHRVTISRGFWIGRCEVTQDQWELVTGGPSFSFFAGGRHPVENVSWDDVQHFIGGLNRLAGGTFYRLPTEAEWEYACRAGNDEPFSFGRDAGLLGHYAWFDGNSSDEEEPAGRTHPVGLLRPNRWGIHDMHGNVWEWCADSYAADQYRNSQPVDPCGPSAGRLRVKRGGSWSYPAHRCRSADRARGAANAGSSSVGFRLVRDAD